jgi:hypothetical protein
MSYNGYKPIPCGFTAGWEKYGDQPLIGGALNRIRLAMSGWKMVVLDVVILASYQYLVYAPAQTAFIGHCQHRFD